MQYIKYQMHPGKQKQKKVKAKYNIKQDLRQQKATVVQYMVDSSAMVL